MVRQKVPLGTGTARYQSEFNRWARWEMCCARGWRTKIERRRKGLSSPFLPRCSSLSRLFRIALHGASILSVFASPCMAPASLYLRCAAHLRCAAAPSSLPSPCHRRRPGLRRRSSAKHTALDFAGQPAPRTKRIAAATLGFRSDQKESPRISPASNRIELSWYAKLRICPSTSPPTRGTAHNPPRYLAVPSFTDHSILSNGRPRFHTTRYRASLQDRKKALSWKFLICENRER